MISDKEYQSIFNHDLEEDIGCENLPFSKFTISTLMKPENRYMFCRNMGPVLFYCSEIRHFISNGYASINHCGNCQKFHFELIDNNLVDQLGERPGRKPL